MFDDLAAAKVAQYKGLFETPIITADVPDVAELTGQLRATIMERRDNHPNASRSSLGGWQSDTNMLQLGGEPARQLGILMVQMCNQFTQDIGQTDPDKPRFEWSAEMWANICPPGTGHESHIPHVYVPTYSLYGLIAAWIGRSIYFEPFIPEHSRQTERV